VCWIGAAQWAVPSHERRRLSERPGPLIRCFIALTGLGLDVGSGCILGAKFPMVRPLNPQFYIAARHGVGRPCQLICIYCLKRGLNYDSNDIVTHEGHKISLPGQKLPQVLALAILLILGGLAIAGPSGLLAWGENLRLLDERNARIAKLEEQHGALANRVGLLNPDHADPDMVGEQLRREFNVVHEDEVVLFLDSK